MSKKRKGKKGAPAALVSIPFNKPKRERKPDAVLIHECLGEDQAYYVHALHTARRLRKRAPRTARELREAAARMAVLAISDRLDEIDVYRMNGYPAQKDATVDYDGDFKRAALLAMVRKHLKSAGLPQDVFDPPAKRRKVRPREKRIVGFKADADRKRIGFTQ